jgi:hypothetical protein
MKKKWVVVLPCGSESIPTILVLKARGYKVIGLDQNNKAAASNSCDKMIISPLDNYEQILYFLKTENIQPECFIPIVSDKAILPAYILNRLFNITPPNDNILAFYSKSILRQTLENSNIPGPNFNIYSFKSELASYIKNKKLIIKPDDSSGSRGISIIDKPSKKKIEEAFDYAINYSSNKKVIIEEYIRGEEYMVDCFIYQDKVKALLVSQKKKIADKVSYLIFTLNKTEFPYDKLTAFIQILTKSLTFSQGPMHIELKYYNGKFYILDLAVRGGGFGVYNYYVFKSLGFSFVNATIDIYLKKKLAERVKYQKEGLIYFLTPQKEGIIEKITCTYKPKETEDFRIDYYYTKGQKLTMDVNDGNRLAGIYCFAANKKELNDLFERVKLSIKITLKK